MSCDSIFEKTSLPANYTAIELNTIDRTCEEARARNGPVEARANIAAPGAGTAGTAERATAAGIAA